MPAPRLWLHPDYWCYWPWWKNCRITIQLSSLARHTYTVFSFSLLSRHQGLSRRTRRAGCCRPVRLKNKFTQGYNQLSPTKCQQIVNYRTGSGKVSCIATISRKRPALDIARRPGLEAARLAKGADDDGGGLLP